MFFCVHACNECNNVDIYMYNIWIEWLTWAFFIILPIQQLRLTKYIKGEQATW